MITLRLPVTPGDIYKWTTEENMPYMNAIRLLPPSMKTRLPSTYHSAFSPYALLNLRRFYSSVANLQVAMEQIFSIVWPPLNVPVLLFQYLKHLALPIELYDATIRLGDRLGYDFVLYTTPNHKLSMFDLPEARLISCLIVCVKLMYPFDNTKCYPRRLTEPAATVIDWNVWSRLVHQKRDQGKGVEHRYTTERLTQVGENDVFSMSNHQIDQYLDFYLTNFMDEEYLQTKEAADGLQAALYNMFPVVSDGTISPQGLLKHHQYDEKLKFVKAVHNATKEVKVFSGEEHEPPRPGARYTQYSQENTLPDHVRHFFEEAGRVAGLTMDMLLSCVQHVERKIARGHDRRKEEGKWDVEHR